MASKGFCLQMRGYGLTTAKILYRLPDHPRILQTYIWQEYDLCPDYPQLRKFLGFWSRSLDGPLHAVTVTHARLIKPTELNFQSGELTVR